MIKLKDILNEASEYDQYMVDFAEKLYKTLKGKKIAGFSIGYDTMSGTIEWVKDEESIVYATPFWEGNKEIPISYINYNSGGDYVDYKTIPFSPTGQFAMDVKRYLKAINPHLIKLFKILKE